MWGPLEFRVWAIEFRDLAWWVLDLGFRGFRIQGFAVRVLGLRDFRI